MSYKGTPVKQAKRKGTEEVIPMTPNSSFTATASTSTASPNKQSKGSNAELTVLFWNGVAIAIACFNAYSL